MRNRLASINLSQLRALIAVADSGAFGAAAIHLGVTQSAVSHTIASLERALGSALLDRSATPIRPTSLGESILAPARKAVAAADAVVAIAAREVRAAQGTVRLAATPTMCRGKVPALLELWRARYPAIEVHVFEGEDEEVADWLHRGQADMAIVVDPPVVPGDARLLLRDDFRVVMRADHPLASQPDVALEDLEDDEFLLSEGGCEPYVARLHALAGSRFIPPPRVKGFATLLDMVGAGIGVSIVPGASKAMLPPNTVLVRLRTTVYRELYLTGPVDRNWLPAVEVLVRSTSA